MSKITTILQVTDVKTKEKYYYCEQLRVLVDFSRNTIFTHIDKYTEKEFERIPLPEHPFSKVLKVSHSDKIFVLMCSDEILIDTVFDMYSIITTSKMEHYNHG